MVFHRRLEYGFNGYRVPAMPRAARSPRRRGGSIKMKGEGYNMCAFDLLAAVAGKLLVGRDTSSSSSSSPSSSNSSTKHDQCTMTGNSNSNSNSSSSLKQESFDQGSCVRGSADSHNTCCFKEITDPVNKNVTGFTEVNVTPDGPPSELDSDKLMKDEAVEDESLKMKNVVDMYSLGKNAPVVWDAKPLAQIKISESAIKETEEHVPHGGTVSPKIRDNNVVLVYNSRDDDESSSGCTHRSSTATKSFRSALCFGDRRIRKVLASKYWKVAKKWKHNLNFPKHEADLKTDEKQSYKHLRSERIFPFKKRKFFDLNTESNSDGEVTGDGSVKLRIGSFKVPELFIEIPETATIGSLKRAVMEAVTAALGGELRVGVLLQGKKVGDDSKTLLQTGICHDEETDVLGFTLEPSSSPSGPPMSAPPLLHCSASQSLFRSEGREGNFSTVNEAHGTNLGNSVESDRVSVASPTDASNRATTMVSKAIVPVSSALKREAALAAVPIRRKPKQSEMAQRRIRRPFSVAEVEALVQAIEKLGTGRWRDVKLRAFDSAKHRTYVDLKDKWKTLVHTARISPQQRRGEPVPQELLDRVLTAHAYWSQHQAKQHLTKHHPQTCLLL